MADTEVSKTIESTIEEKKVEEKEKLAEKPTSEDPKVEENGEKAENGDSKKDDTTKPEEEEEEEKAVSDKCCIKRKSTGDAVDGKAEESTPEKKAKVDSAPAEVEANGEVTEAEVGA